MSIEASPEEYQTAEKALMRLVVPSFQPNRTFRVSSSAFLGLSSGQKAIDAWELTAKEFASEEDFREAAAAPFFWSSELFMDPVSRPEQVVKTAAIRLEGVLGHLGDKVHQRQACEAFERFFGGMTLAFNDHLETGESGIDSFLQSENAMRAARFPNYPPLFDNTVEAQADLERAKNQGIWTVVDQWETITLSASSDPQVALAKAWSIAPELAPFRRLQTLESGLPAPKPRVPGIRF